MNLLLLLTSTLQLATRTPNYIEEAQAGWDGLAEVTVVSVKCGEENAYYQPWDKTVVMCTELYRKPDLALFIFNHEMGHAFMYQHGIANSERGADELAFLMSPDTATMAAIRWFWDMAKKYPPRDGDPHETDRNRAASLVCLMDGADMNPVSPHCYMYFSSINENWARMLMLSPDIIE